VAKATIFPIIYFVASSPAVSNIFNFPDTSINKPAHATRLNFSAGNDIAVDAVTCFDRDSSNVGDLY
jgi:hypothetical protein